VSPKVPPSMDLYQRGRPYSMLEPLGRTGPPILGGRRGRFGGGKNYAWL